MLIIWSSRLSTQEKIGQNKNTKENQYWGSSHLNYYLLQRGCSLLTCFESLLPVLGSYQVNTLALTIDTVQLINALYFQLFMVSEIRTMHMYLAIMSKDCFLFCKSCSCPGFKPIYYFCVDNRHNPLHFVSEIRAVTYGMLKCQ